MSLLRRCMFDEPQANGGAVTNLDFARGGSPPLQKNLHYINLTFTKKALQYLYLLIYLHFVRVKRQLM